MFSFIVVLASYWVIGLPLGHILSLYTPLAAFGYWVGLIVGLAIGATSLLIRMVSFNEMRQWEEKRLVCANNQVVLCVEASQNGKFLRDFLKQKDIFG